MIPELWHATPLQVFLKIVLGASHTVELPPLPPNTSSTPQGEPAGVLAPKEAGPVTTTKTDTATTSAATPPQPWMPLTLAVAGLLASVGGNGSKSFTLIYHLETLDQIYQRFPGVEGTAYFIGGVGVNYQQAGNIKLAPMRVGVGFRAGANVGYLSYSRERNISPF